MTEADISNLPYLKCVAKEALRLHPPSPLMLPHKANANVKIGGYAIPKGTAVHEMFGPLGVIRRCGKTHTISDPRGSSRQRRLMCPAAQVGSNLVTRMRGHLLHSFAWSSPEGVQPKEIDISESPGLVCYMKTPLEAVPQLRLPERLYKHML